MLAYYANFCEEIEYDQSRTSGRVINAINSLDGGGREWAEWGAEEIMCNSVRGKGGKEEETEGMSVRLQLI